MELESQPGRGTRFQIDFPRVVSAEKPRARGTGSDKRASGVFVAEHIEGRFLVLDDDPSLREMIATALQMRGAEVVAAASLEEALAAEGPFKLAITDLMLGEQRGDLAIAQLRDAGLVDLALMVTGTELPQRFAARGEPDAVVRKPFELQDLFESVAEVLGRGHTDKTAAR
jgi:two-component system, OmpR family, response regulator